MDTSTLTMTDFLLARYAEDEAIAKAAQSASGRDPWRAKTYRVVVDNGDFEVAQAAVPTAAHMARHDPARVLAECEAKRRIVNVSTTDIAASQSAKGAWHKHAEMVMRLLALPYADHPDYRDDWRP